jgi:hypothetical protein
MENHFSNLMLQEKLQEAADLLYDESIKIIEGTIKDSDRLHEDTEFLVWEFFKEIKNCYSKISFDTVWQGVLEGSLLRSKEYVKTNIEIFSTAEDQLRNFINQSKLQHFAEFYFNALSDLKLSERETIEESILV